jgi:hypothetical protein
MIRFGGLPPVATMLEKSSDQVPDERRAFWKLHRGGPVWPGQFPQTPYGQNIHAARL